MALIDGQPGEEPGDQMVYKALLYLPDDYIIYAQKKLVHGSQERNPDYVIVHREYGVIVIEVKDWIKVEKRDEKNAWVYRYKVGKCEQATSPVEQARQAAHVLIKKLEEDPDLRNYAGKLDFPYRFAGALPHLPMPTITWLEKAWGVGTLLGRDDLTAERIRDKVTHIPAPFYAPMSERQFNAVRAILDTHNKVSDPKTGRFKGIYDPQQEAIAKEPIQAIVEITQSDKLRPQPVQKETKPSSFFPESSPNPEERLEHLSETTPLEVVQLQGSTNIRLVRGFAGTGKTDVLVLRAYYLHRQYPEKTLLVTTFNRPLLEERLVPELRGIAEVHTFDELCSQIYQRKHGTWVLPQSTEGVIARLAQQDPRINMLGATFLAEEIIWLKENHLTERQKYIDTHREGRAGMSRVLSRKDKATVFDLYELYQNELEEVSPHDWPDFHDKILKYLRGGTQPEKYYDVILVDEAQHFAPTWIQVLHHFLKPNGALFLCDDPSQSVYRLFSWRQRGIEVVGRTRWLRIPYRNTRQIFEAAYTLITTNPLAKKMLEESEDHLPPDLENIHLRDGEFPHVYQFGNANAECEFLQSKINVLINQGLLPTEICLLHTQKHVINYYRSIFPKGVQIDDLRRRTGMEYPVVFIPRIQEIVDRDIQFNWEEDLARQQILFYMAMTRARDHLYLLYEQKWPKAFEPIRPKVVWHLN
jgi:hypothetical protein